MDLWQLITNDHANIADLCGEIPRTFPGGGVRSRERLFSELDAELRRHLKAEEESLYDSLEDRDRAEHLVAELEHEHEEIERQLGDLARVRDKGSLDWTQSLHSSELHATSGWYTLLRPHIEYGPHASA